MSDVVIGDVQQLWKVYYTDLLTEGMLVILLLMLFYVAIQLWLKLLNYCLFK